jgi:propionate CoA-transferase
VHELVGRYYVNVTRYGSSGFVRAKLGAALAAHGVSPHLYATAEEARAHLLDS